MAAAGRWGLVLAAAAGASGPGLAEGGPAPAAVERTLVCTVAANGGVRALVVEARAGLRPDTPLHRLASVSVHSAAAPAVGAPSGPTPVSLRWAAAASAGRAPGEQLGLSARTRERGSPCRPSRVRPPLARRGLVARPVFAFGGQLRCPAPARVLVHLHGVFTRPARFVPAADPGPFRTLRAAGALRSGRLVVSTPAGRPLLHARVSESGEARLHAARSCS